MISNAPIVFIDGGFYVVGGYPSSKTQIARLDASTMIWTDAGALVTGRFYHNAIYDGASLIVVGGDGTKKTEVCNLSNGIFSCVEQNPELSEYYGYPELFLVAENFCKELS